MSSKPEQIVPRPRRAPGWLVVFAAGLALAAAGLGVRTVLVSPRVSADSLPDFEVDGTEDVVVARLTSLREAVRRDPRSATSWGSLGMAFDVHGFTRQALVCYRQATALDPSDFRWRYYGAIALQGLASPSSIEWFERARTLRPDYAPLFLRYGQALLASNRADQAAEAFHTALEIDDRLSHAHFALAQIALSRNDVTASRDHLARAAQVAPSHGAVHRLLAEVYRRLGHPDSAALVGRRAEYLLDQPSFADPVYAELLRGGVSSRWHMVRGQVYLERGRPDLAKTELVKAIEIRADADAHNNLGIALQRLGDFEAAAEQHRAALNLRPRFPAALTNLGSALLELGRADEAIAAADSALRLDSTFVQAYFNLSVSHTRRGDPRAAIAALRAGMTKAAYDPRIANRLAWFLATVPDARLRNGAQAVQLAEELCALTGYGVAEAMDVLGAAYAEVGRFDDALETARRAQELALAAGQPTLAEGVERRLLLYESGQPYRDQDSARAVR